MTPVIFYDGSDLRCLPEELPQKPDYMANKYWVHHPVAPIKIEGAYEKDMEQYNATISRLKQNAVKVENASVDEDGDAYLHKRGTIIVEKIVGDQLYTLDGYSVSFGHKCQMTFDYGNYCRYLECCGKFEDIPDYGGFGKVDCRVALITKTDKPSTEKPEASQDEVVEGGRNNYSLRTFK